MPVRSEIRRALHSLRRAPAFSLVSIVILCLVLGTAITVFNVVHTVLWQALPFPEPDRLFDVSLWVPAQEGHPGGRRNLELSILALLQREARQLESVAAYQQRPFTVRLREEAERVQGAEVSPELLSLLRVPPAHGDVFPMATAGRPSEAVSVLSWGFARDAFGSGSEAVGSLLEIDGRPHRVLGVMPSHFSFPAPEVRFWVPLAVAPASAESIQERYLPAIARLRTGASPEAATGEARSLRANNLASPGDQAVVHLSPLREERVARVRPGLLAIGIAGAAAFLIACVNLTSLSLARGITLQRDLAVRFALGARRIRLFWTPASETLLVVGLGALGGWIIAAFLEHALPRWLPEDLPRVEEIGLDGTAVLLGIGLALIAAVVIGSGLVWAAMRIQPSTTLRAGASTDRRHTTIGKSLVVGQVALAVLLLVGAALLLQHYRALLATESGYAPEGAVGATLVLDSQKYERPAAVEALLTDLLQRLGDHAAIDSVGIVRYPPLSATFGKTPVDVAGLPPALRLAVPQLTSAGYLSAVGARMEIGRWISPEDEVRRRPVAVVNQAFVREVLPDLPPLEQRLEIGSASLEIVGVVRDLRLLGPTHEVQPAVFVSYRLTDLVAGSSPESISIIVRSSLPPRSLIPSLRPTLRELDPQLPLEAVGPLENRLLASLVRPRFYAGIVGSFSLLSLLLSASGVLGLLSVHVARQTRALGVRRALGARRHDIQRLVLAEGFTLLAMGLAAGGVLTILFGILLAGTEFSIGSEGLEAFATATAALVVAGLAACWLPARRAARVSPLDAIRYE